MLRKWLANDITELIAKDLLLVQGVIDLEGLDNDKKYSYLQEAHALWENRVFQDLVKRIAETQKELTFSQAQTEKQIWAGRCNVATTSLFRDEAERLESLYQGMKEPESFDKNAII